MNRSVHSEVVSIWKGVVSINDIGHKYLTGGVHSEGNANIGHDWGRLWGK